MRVQCSGTLIIVYLSTELLSVPSILPVVVEKKSARNYMQNIKTCDAFVPLHLISSKRYPMQQEVCVFLWLFKIFLFWLRVLLDTYEVVAETLVVPLLM